MSAKHFPFMPTFVEIDFDMAKKFWCISTSHPLARQVADKYNITKDTAKNILNNAKEQDPTLNLDEGTLEYLESNEAFREALNTYTQKLASIDDFLLRETRAKERDVNSMQKQLEEELGLTLPADEVQEMMDKYKDIKESAHTAGVSAKEIAEIITAFKDTSRMEWIGNWLCKSMSFQVSLFATDAEYRKEWDVPMCGSRQEYYTNPECYAALKEIIEYALDDATEDCKNRLNRPDLANELQVTKSHMKTFLYMYGGSLFREEGIAVTMSGIEARTDTNDAATRNEISEDDDENDNGEEPEGGQSDSGEELTSDFGASDQNKSITTKIVPSIKLLFYTLPKKDRNGRKVESKYYPLNDFLDSRTIQKTLEICRGCLTFEDMMKKLKENESAHPWITNIIRAIDVQDEFDDKMTRVTSSQKEQVRSMFFKSFRKTFVPFRTTYVQYGQNGLPYFVNADANTKHRKDAILRGVKRYFAQLSGIGIFQNGQFSKEAMAEGEKILNDFDTRLRELRTDLWWLIHMPTVKQYTQGKDLKTELAKQDAIKKDLHRFINEFLGFKVQKEQFDALVFEYGGNDPNYSPEEVQNANLVDIVGVMQRFMQFLPGHGGRYSMEDATVNPFNVKYEQGNEEAHKAWRFRNMAEGVAEYLSKNNPDSIESSCHVAGKDYYSWNNPSTATDIVEGINKDGKKFIKERYCKDARWFLRPDSTAAEPKFYSHELQAMYDSDVRNYQYSEKLSFNGKKYGDQTDTEYALSILNDFFTTTSYVNTGSWYRMFIASDKPKYASFRLSRYDVNEEKDKAEVISQAEDFFAQELLRACDTIDHAITDNVIRIDGYDIVVSNKKDPKSVAIRNVIEKVKAGEKVTPKDVILNGKYIFRETGASFYLSKFLNNEIEEKTPLGKFLIDRIFNHGLNDASDELIPGSRLKQFREGFEQYMSDIKADYLKYLDEIGAMRAEFRKDKGSDSAVAHMYYFREQFRQWAKHDKVFSYSGYIYVYGDDPKAVALFKEKAREWGIPEDEATKSYYPYICERLYLEKIMTEFVYNNWYAKANMSEIFDTDLAFFGNTPNYQKREAQTVSSGYKIDKGARIHGELVSDGKYRSATLRTPKVGSKHIENIRTLLNNRLAEVSDAKRRSQLKVATDSIIKTLMDFDATDGQSLTSLTALRKRQAGLGEWSRSANKEDDVRGYTEKEDGTKEYIFTHEAVYQRLLRGEPVLEDFEFVFAQPQKPFATGTYEVERGEGKGKRTVPFQHKNSEYMLSYALAFLSQREPDSPMAAIAKFMEETAKAHPRQGIDTFNFDSSVKIGGNSGAIDLTGLNGQQVYQALFGAIYDEGGNYKTGVVTEYDTDSYKIVQEKPEHFKKHKQPMGTQMKILAIANIGDDATVTLPTGETISGKELRNRYLNSLRRKMGLSLSKFRSQFGIHMTRDARLNKLSNALKDAMASDQKFTPDMRYGLSVVDKNGVNEFALPLDDPSQQSAIEAMLYSKIRKAYYKEKTNGGIVVQATSWGSADDLHIRFRDKRGGLLITKEEFAEQSGLSGGKLDEAYQDYCNQYQGEYDHFEAEVPMPDYIKRMLLGADGKIQEKYILKDSQTGIPIGWNMEEIKKTVPDSCFDAICYRLPTEAKYSMMKVRIKRFSLDGPGSVAKYPVELTVFTGSDFDIDTDTIELRPEPNDKTEEAKIDNEIFDLQCGALQTYAAAPETFKSGDFSDLQELSYKVVLLEAGYTEEQLAKMSFKELKTLCAQVEDLDLMNPKTDIILHNQNSDAKQMIAIAAVGVTSHAFMSLYNETDVNDETRNPAVHPENFLRCRFAQTQKTNESFTVINDIDPKNPNVYKIGDGSEYALFDQVYDMDGNLISTEISKYVGGSADAAKDSAENRLNITADTLPVLIFMHRLGISSNVARLFIRQPVIKRLMQHYKQIGRTGEVALDEAADRTVAELRDESGKLLDQDAIQKKWAAASANGGKVLRYSDLIRTIAHPESQSVDDKFQMITLFQILHSKSQVARNLDGFTRYNANAAMKGSSFLTRYAKRQQVQKLNDNLLAGKPTFLLPQDVAIEQGRFKDDEFGRLCSMFPYIGDTIEGEDQLVEKIILENMKSYSAPFFEAAKRFGIETDEKALRNLYNGWKSWLLFMGPNRIADFRNPEEAKYYTRDYAKHYTEEFDRIQREHPDVYAEVIADNAFIDEISMEHAKVGYGDFNVLTVEATFLKGLALDKFQADWAKLMDHKETRRLGIDITIHFLARSAGFARNTPVTIMPSKVKMAVTGLVEAFEQADRLPMDDAEFNEFCAVFALNNVTDKSIVPHVYNTARNKKASVANGNEGTVLTVSRSAKAVSASVSGNANDGYVLNKPVIAIRQPDGTTALYLITSENNEITVSPGQGKNDPGYFHIPVIPVQPYGIPYQLAEYRSGIFGLDSLYKDAAVQDEIGNESVMDGYTAQKLANGIEEEIPVLYSEGYEGVRQLPEPSKYGTFIDTTPFGNEYYDEDVERLADNADDFREGVYMETRTYIKRANKLIEMMGLKMNSSARRISNTGAGYDILVAPSENMDVHEAAIRAATLLSELGLGRDEQPVVKTFLPDYSDETPTGVEYLIRLSQDASTETVKKLVQFDKSLAYNPNTHLLTATFSLPGRDNLPELKRQIDGHLVHVDGLLQSLHKAGIETGDPEASFILLDVLDEARKKQILNEIKNETELNPDDASASDELFKPESAGQGKERVRLSDIVNLAIRKANGEKVNDEIRQLFGETKHRLTGADQSVRSKNLVDEVTHEMGYSDVAEQVEQIFAERGQQQSRRQHSIENLIINTANQLLGNTEKDALTQMFEKAGFGSETATSVMDIIKQKIDELDIC